MTRLLGFLLLLSVVACKPGSDEVRQVNTAVNQWSYQGCFKLNLPLGYSFDKSKILTGTGTKYGEVVMSCERLQNHKFTGWDFIEQSKNGGRIITELGVYNASCPACAILKTDSVRIGDNQWYYIVQTMDSSVGSPENGITNAFSFANIQKGKITDIVFYNPNLEDLNIDPYKNILSTIE